MQNKGVLIVSVVVIVILILLIASISIYSGNRVINNSETTKKDENLVVVKAVINQLYINNINKSEIYPLYGKPAIIVYNTSGDSLNDWYIISKEDLNQMGINYIDEVYAVNYKENKVLTISDFYYYIESKNR